MKPLRPSLSVLVLTVANLVPLLGVVLFQWGAAQLVFLYWVENLVIGFYTVLKMALLNVGNPLLHLAKLVQIPVFCLHFGFFCAIHGIFLVVLFKPGDEVPALFQHLHGSGQFLYLDFPASVIAAVWHQRPPGIEWPACGLLVSHGVSFVQNFLANEAYAFWNVGDLMRQPYNRMVILHLAIIGGGVSIVKLGSPIPLLCILVLLKLGLDICLHLRERGRELAKSNPPVTATA